MTKSHSLKRLVFVFPRQMTAGGMPDDCRQFISTVAGVFSGEVVLLVKGSPVDKEGLLGEIDVKIDIDHKGQLGAFFRTVSNSDFAVFFTFSSLVNVSLARRFYNQGCRYSVMPAWQINEFLDRDRPFSKTAIPTIESAEKDSLGFKARAGDGVVEGKVTIRSRFRAVKRKLYRATLGRNLLQRASAIHVFSDFERENISRLISLKAPQFCDVEFGTDISTRPIGEDVFSQDGVRNIVFWGRVDYFYKGLDLIIDAIALAHRKAVRTPFTLWICGPDYNGGYQKILDHVERRGVSNYVRILTPSDYTSGTVGLLANADFSILGSRWDGFSRALRESIVLGVPIITNDQTHFDRAIKRFGSGVIFADTEDLSRLLVDLDNDAPALASEKAKASKDVVEEYYSWRQCGRRFIKTLSELD